MSKSNNNKKIELVIFKDYQEERVIRKWRVRRAPKVMWMKVFDFNSEVYSWKRTRVEYEIKGNLLIITRSIDKDELNGN